MPYYSYSQYECNLLWINKKYFTGHSKWIYQLLRSINWNKIPNDKNEYEKTILELLENNRKYKCWNLMCSRDCRQKITNRRINYIIVIRNAKKN